MVILIRWSAQIAETRISIMNLQSIAPITNTRCRSCGKMTNVGACARATRDLRIVHSESRSLPCGLRSGNAKHVFRASDLVIGYGPVPLSHPLIFSFSSPSPISAQLDHFQSVSRFLCGCARLRLFSPLDIGWAMPTLTRSKTAGPRVTPARVQCFCRYPLYRRRFSLPALATVGTRLSKGLAQSSRSRV